MSLLTAVFNQGTHSARPAAAAGNAGYEYFETDTNGGTLFQSTGSAWVQLAPGVTQTGNAGWNFPADGRLTLTTAVPVTTADVSAATTLYYTPYVGTQIALYNGATWDLVTFAEISITNAGLSASLPYDVFCYNNGGTPTLELLAWTSATARATALVMQNGILCKTGALTRRYLGTIYTDTASKFNDSGVNAKPSNRTVWNYYHRVLRSIWIQDTNTHTYAVAANRAWNNDTTLRGNFVIGVAEDALVVSIDSDWAPPNAAAVTVQPALDGVAPIDYFYMRTDTNFTTADVYMSKMRALQTNKVGIGFHYFQIAQYAGASCVFDSATMSLQIMG